MSSDARSPWWLVDGEARSLAAPRSFFIPPREHRAGLTEGRVATLAFTRGQRLWSTDDEADGERLPVKIRAADGDGSYVGEVQRDATSVPELTSGTEISFEARHVLEIAYRPGELGYDRDEVAAIDPKCLEDDLAPTRVVPFTPDGQTLSIWLLTLDGPGPQNAAVVEVGALTDFWPELAPIFRAREGMWRRDPDRGEYVLDTGSTPKSTALVALADAAQRCLDHPRDPSAAAAEAHFEDVLDTILALHWPGAGDPKAGRPDGVGHPGVIRGDGRVRLDGKVWVRDGADRSVSVDVSPTDGGTVRLSEPIGKSRRGRRTKGQDRQLDDWALVLEIPGRAAEARPAPETTPTPDVATPGPSA